MEMAKPIKAMPGRSKQVPLRLPSDLADDFHVYREVTAATQTGLICKAVRQLIDRELEENPGIKRQFDEAKIRYLEAQRHTKRGVESIRLVDKTNVKSRNRSGRRPKNAGNGEAE